MKISHARMEEIKKICESIFARINFYDFMRALSENHLGKVSVVTGVPLREIVSCHSTVLAWTLLGLYDQDLDYARKHKPEDIPFWEDRVAAARARVLVFD